MENRNELQQKIIERAMSDETFKNNLMNNPKETLKNEYNIDIPEEIQINVFEEKENEFYLVIPKSPEDDSDSNLVW